MTDIAMIIKTITEMQSSINTDMTTGFTIVHEKIDKQFGKYNERLGTVETKIAVKEALCEKKDENTKSQHDYWLYIIRAVTIAGVLALFGLAFGVKI